MTKVETGTHTPNLGQATFIENPTIELVTLKGEQKSDMVDDIPHKLDKRGCNPKEKCNPTNGPNCYPWRCPP